MPFYPNYQTPNKKYAKSSPVINTISKTANNLVSNKKLMDGVERWTSFYRSRPDIFCEEFLGIKLKSFQKVLLFAMIHNNYTMFLASRGLGKTWLTALYCIVRSILFPGSKIVVASAVKSQAMKIVTEKIPEIIKLSSTGMVGREIKFTRTNMNTDEPNIEFANGSWIKVVPATHNARSGRANILILDEFRMIKPDIYKSVLRRFLATSRQPGFLQKSQYSKQQYQERNQEIFLTSCYYKYNWAYSRYRVFYSAMLKGKGYFVCGLPYQIGIKENLTSKAQLIDEMQEDDFDPISWEMEMNCMFYGESKNAYYKFEELNKIRTNYKPIVPFKPEEYAVLKGNRSKLPFYREKQKDEYRILSLDAALIGGTMNDATQYMLLSMTPSGTGSFQKNLEYVESADGGNSEYQALRLKQLFYDLECDYCVMDTQGNAIGIYDILTKETYDEERDKYYPAWITINDENKNIIRAIDKNALPVVYSIVTAGASAGALLHEMYTYTKNQIERKRLRLLIGEFEAKEFLIDKYDFLTKDAYTQAEMFLPYAQTGKLITELTQLQSEVRGGFIRLSEPAGKRKDRAMCLLYGMYFIKLKEAEIKNKEKGSNYSDILSLMSIGQKKSVGGFKMGQSPFGRTIPAF